jgi:hypothetical protein
MAIDCDIVRWVQKCRSNLLVRPDETLEKIGVAAIATSDSVIAQAPNITSLHPAVGWRGGDHFVVRIYLLGVQQNIYLSSTESSYIKTEVQIQR